MHPLLLASSISFLLAIAKGCAFAFSGSLIVFASFLDSLMDVVLSWLNYKLARAAHIHADKEHPYGHGGFEVISMLFQGILIAASGSLVVYQTINRFLSPTGYRSVALDEIPLAVGIMVLSTLGGGLISFFLRRQKSKLNAQKQRSLSVDADHAHYVGDLIQNGFGILGLLLTLWFQSPWIDMLVGGFVGLVLLKTAIPLLRTSVRDIMNTEFDESLHQKILDIVADVNIPQIKGVHRVRSRTLGPHHFIDFHLKLPDDIKLIEAHKIAYCLEEHIQQEIPRSDVMIHLDPETEPDDEL